MTDSPPRLLLVAHGTRSAAGSATAARIAQTVAAARPGVTVELCFLDIAQPSLVDALAAAAGGPTVLVPMLLSTGYHVQHDIPAAVQGDPSVTVTRHLGPHPLLARAMAERLYEAGGRPGVATVLVAAGSTRAEAAAELDEAARLLDARLGSEVSVATMADDMGRVLAASGPLQVAVYLLAEGQFTDTIRAAANGAVVAAPIGEHPALVELILARYDSAVG